MLGNAQDMSVIADVVGGPPEGIPINSTDVEMEEGNLLIIHLGIYDICIDYLLCFKLC